MPKSKFDKPAFLVVFANHVEHALRDLIGWHDRSNGVEDVQEMAGVGEKISIVSPSSHFFPSRSTNRSNRMRPERPQIVPKRSTVQIGGDGSSRRVARIRLWRARIPRKH
jgi:hypothetical protein